jgi:hypothetical protein
LPVLHADFFAVCAILAFFETYRCHEGRSLPLSPYGASVSDADAAHRTALFDETRRHAIRLIQRVDRRYLPRDIFLPIAVDPRADPDSPRAERGNPPRRENPFGPGCLGLLRACGFSLFVALARAAVVGAVSRTGAIKSNAQLCSSA